MSLQSRQIGRRGPATRAAARTVAARAVPARTVPARTVAALALAALTLAGSAACGVEGTGSGIGPSALPSSVSSVSPAQSASSVSPAQSASSSVQPVLVAATTCTPGPTASYPPLADTSPARWPSGSLMQTIKDRGYLVVGVSGDTRLLGARNALKGGQLEGFDIGVARQVAAAIFGNPDAIRFKVITAGQRIPLVNAGAGTRQAPAAGVDLVARAMTMTCDRWNNADPAKRVAFSSVYLLARQRLLVRSDSGVTSVAQLQEAQARVCAPAGSTSLARIKEFPGLKTVPVEIHSDCLALWQQGKVDAITGDDTILAGFKAQDPHAVIVGPGLEDEPYGLAVASSHKEFAQFLNVVLARMRADGTWRNLYDSWLASALGSASAPTPDYGRSA
jgi:polar amino acid transport system substrate-binding protein